MVVNRHGKLLLGGILTNYVLVKVLLYLHWLREFVGRAVGLFLAVIFENGIADGNAFVTDVRARIVRGGGDQLSNDILAFMAERTTQRIIGACTLHGVSYTKRK